MLAPSITHSCDWSPALHAAQLALPLDCTGFARHSFDAMIWMVWYLLPEGTSETAPVQPQVYVVAVWPAAVLHIGGGGGILFSETAILTADRFVAPISSSTYATGGHRVS
eukprot:COSAG01_NODE_791_length_13556_cov_214.163930_13_plen_110_part_00